MITKVVFIVILAGVFLYRILRDSMVLTKQLVVTQGKFASYEVLNRRVILSLVPWLVAIWYYNNILLVSWILIYEFSVYLIVITLSHLLYHSATYKRQRP